MGGSIGSIGSRVASGKCLQKPAEAVGRGDDYCPQKLAVVGGWQLPTEANGGSDQSQGGHVPPCAPLPVAYDQIFTRSSVKPIYMVLTFH